MFFHYFFIILFVSSSKVWYKPELNFFAYFFKFIFFRITLSDNSAVFTLVKKKKNLLRDLRAHLKSSWNNLMQKFPDCTYSSKFRNFVKDLVKVPMYVLVPLYLPTKKVKSKTMYTTLLFLWLNPNFSNPGFLRTGTLPWWCPCPNFDRSHERGIGIQGLLGTTVRENLANTIGKFLMLCATSCAPQATGTKQI